MGFFSRKPDKELQAEFVKQATYAVTWFGHALRFKSTNPNKALKNEGLDLTDAKNRTAIHVGLIKLIQTHSLSGDPSSQSTESLISLVKQTPTTVLDDAVVCTMLAIHAMNMTARFFYLEYPKYEPLREMVNHLAKIGCPGAAQTIGSTLPDEVVSGWPHFAQMFASAKEANLLLWPDT
jgi:hypothetical protein